MEPFTHALTSLALSRAIPSRLPRLGTALLVTAGIAPDLDYASYFGGPGAFLAIHRSALHSVGGAAVTSCTLAALFCVLDKRWPPRKSAQRPATFAAALALCVAGTVTHDLLDLASGEGLQLLWPFGVHWSHWNLAASFDPWILILLLGGFLIPQLFALVGEEVGAPKKSSAGSGAAAATLLLLFTYLGARAYLHNHAVEVLLSSEYHGREPLSAGAFPSSANPFEWRGLVSTDKTIEELAVNLSPGADFNPDRSLTHYKPAGSPALEVGEKTPAAQKFLKYAEFPLASVAHREDGYRFELRDLRFPSSDNGPENLLARADLASDFRITLQQIRYASSGEN